MKAVIRMGIMMLLIVITSQLKAQKKPYYTEQEKIIEEAYKNLDFNMEQGVIKEWAVENNIQGSYTMNLTIKHKGQVVTINTIERDGGDIPTQNRVKNFMKLYQFPFKMPKDKSYQFKYQFKF